jgi:leader peptidase (prepilin peptidase)/N-methyltransferase
MDASLGTRPRILAFALISAAAAAACFLLFPPAKAACGSLFLAALAGASIIDLELMIIPDLLTVGLAAAGVVLSAAVPALHGFAGFGASACLRSAAVSVMGVALGSALGLWIGIAGEAVLRKEVLGFGDVKFLGAIGAFCGWQGAVFSVFGGALLGAAALAAAAALRAASGGRAAPLFRIEDRDGAACGVGPGARFPFGPMLAAAAAAYFIALHPWADRHLAEYAALF